MDGNIAAERGDRLTASTRLPYRILVAEDEPSLLRGLEINFKQEGYEVLKATTGESCIRTAIQHNPQLIILDLMLPDMSGFDVCRGLRQAGLESIIIILTVKGQEMDRVLGLELGADDYVTKPFSLRELLARVRAHLRRRPLQPNSLPRYSFGDVDLDFEKFVAHRRGRELRLTGKEFELLHLLVSHPGEVLSRDRILQVVWGYESSPTTRTVDNHILRLRSKLENDPAHPRHILSVYGAGYKFVA